MLKADHSLQPRVVWVYEVGGRWYFALELRPAEYQRFPLHEYRRFDHALNRDDYRWLEDAYAEQ